MARVATELLHTPGVQGVNERMAAGTPQMPVLQVRFDPSTMVLAAVVAAAEHGLLIDPANHLPVAVTTLAGGKDPVAFVRQVVAEHEASHGRRAGETTAGGN